VELQGQVADQVVFEVEMSYLSSFDSLLQSSTVAGSKLAEVILGKGARQKTSDDGGYW